MICPICKVNLIKRKIDFSMFGEKLGQFIAECCNKCGEQYFSKDVSFIIEQIARKKGLWNLKYNTRINELGNSLAIRFNKRISDFLNIKKGEEVIVHPDGKNKIIITRRIIT